MKLTEKEQARILDSAVTKAFQAQVRQMADDAATREAEKWIRENRSAIAEEVARRMPAVVKVVVARLIEDYKKNGFIGT